MDTTILVNSCSPLSSSKFFPNQSLLEMDIIWSFWVLYPKFLVFNRLFLLPIKHFGVFSNLLRKLTYFYKLK